MYTYNMCVCVRKYIFIYIYIGYICIYIYVCTCVYTCMCVYIYICSSIRTYIPLCVIHIFFYTTLNGNYILEVKRIFFCTQAMYEHIPLYAIYTYIPLCTPCIGEYFWVEYIVVVFWYLYSRACPFESNICIFLYIYIYIYICIHHILENVLKLTVHSVVSNICIFLYRQYKYIILYTIYCRMPRSWDYIFLQAVLINIFTDNVYISVPTIYWRMSWSCGSDRTRDAT